MELADNGFAGSTVVATARMLGSRHLYTALKAHESADLALLLSDDVYRSTVAGGHTTVTPGDFRRVMVQEKEYEAAAWLQVPGCDVGGLRSEVGTTEESRSGPDNNSEARHGYWGEQVNVNHFTAPVDLRGGVVGFGSAGG
ncbi:hypothetical protein [Streptomyces sp. WZ-12]|uniref:hypothetical protein n=1 Tax=Streptomyces sp. WZ-12 TaxID=3030210 RepID=UPI0023813997|nr:hypothetical protein [Streptomyces sp. WZ-12]